MILSDVHRVAPPRAGSSRLRSTVLALGGLGAAALAWALVEARWYVLRWATVPALAPGSRPLRVLHLSDLHLVPWDGGKHAFVRRAMATGPDLVVVTGDLIGHPDTVDDAVALLGPLAHDRPALFSLGSNDFYGPVPKSPTRYFAPQRERVPGTRLDTRRLVEGLTAAGWISVENRRLPLETPAGLVDVLGLGDAHVHHDRPQEWAPVHARATPVLRLGVAHAPYLRVLDRFAAEDVDLVFAGHTHGGQVRVPGIGALVDNCDLPLHQARGLSAHTPSMWLHVSAGLGTSLYTPIRFACRPEASVVDIVARCTDDAPARAH
jgi:uncharacterized protein